ncbi:MAG: T9SS type A sorting domain-containing protein [Chitinophagaceae bacterium]
MVKPFAFTINKKTFTWRLAMPGFFLVASLSSAAQLYIGPGAQVQLTGSAGLTLNNTDLTNNGTFSAGNGTVYFSGAQKVAISGTQTVQFYTLRINRDPGSSIVLQRSISLSNQLQFSQGFIDLNGQNLDLGSTGQLTGESETSRILGTAGGEVLFTATLNAPSNANPGNLGAQISSTRNMGSVQIKRGHRAQSITGSSILRYYNITPANNSSLGATLRFYYLDAELNGLTENSLVQWRSTDGITWLDQRRSSSDVALNYVEKTGIDAFSVWTLSGPSGALPVVFKDFHLQCDGDKAILRWKTSQESNSSHFSIERNSGTGWISIGQLPAAGNSSTEKSYEFTDPNPIEKAQYRVAQYDLDGQVKYTPIVIFNCSLTNTCQVWPNPFGQVFTIKIRNDRNDQVRLRVIDARGVVIINRSLNLLRGFNQFEVNLQQVASGAYLLIMEWADGHQAKTMRLIKQ